MGFKKIIEELKVNKEHLNWLIQGLKFVTFILFMALILFVSPLIFQLFMSPDDIVEGFSLSGSIGDTVNGIMGPLVGSLAVVTTFLAFIVQFEANKQIRKDIKKDRFETKFYELLRLHKDNVNEIEISNKFRGRKAFVKMYYEFRFIYFSIIHTKDKWNSQDKLINPNGEPNINYSLDVLTEIAYTIFFFGVGGEFEGSLLYSSATNNKFVEKCIDYLKIIQEKYSDKVATNFVVSSSAGSMTFNTDFYPFDGHASKLGHYFRHLYQAIKFIVTDESLELEPEEKYEYIKTLRAQLSNHEQTMIYYNSFFRAGKVWWGDKSIKQKNEEGGDISYFLDWGIIKNIPLNLASFGKLPMVKFEEMLRERGKKNSEINERMEELFEWLEE